MTYGLKTFNEGGHVQIDPDYPFITVVQKGTCNNGEVITWSNTTTGSNDRVLLFAKPNTATAYTNQTLHAHIDRSNNRFRIYGPKAQATYRVNFGNNSNSGIEQYLGLTNYFWDEDLKNSATNWNSSTTYGTTAIVKHGGKYYFANHAPGQTNKNKNPSTNNQGFFGTNTSTYWSKDYPDASDGIGFPKPFYNFGHWEAPYFPYRSYDDFNDGTGFVFQQGPQQRATAPAQYPFYYRAMKEVFANDSYDFNDDHPHFYSPRGYMFHEYVSSFNYFGNSSTSTRTYSAAYRYKTKMLGVDDPTDYKIDYVLCVQKTPPEPTSGYGLNVYQSDGNIAYSSEYDHLRVQDLKQTNCNVPELESDVRANFSQNDTSDSFSWANYYVLMNDTDPWQIQTFADPYTWVHTSQGVAFDGIGNGFSGRIKLKQVLAQLGPQDVNDNNHVNYAAFLSGTFYVVGPFELGKHTYDDSGKWFTDSGYNVGFPTRKTTLMVARFSGD